MKSHLEGGSADEYPSKGYACQIIMRFQHTPRIILALYADQREYY
jgi:hypothetical protein